MKKTLCFTVFIGVAVAVSILMLSKADPLYSQFSNVYKLWQADTVYSTVAFKVADGDTAGLGAGTTIPEGGFLTRIGEFFQPYLDGAIASFQGDTVKSVTSMVSGNATITGTLDVTGKITGVDTMEAAVYTSVSTDTVKAGVAFRLAAIDTAGVGAGTKLDDGYFIARVRNRLQAYIDGTLASMQADTVMALVGTITTIDATTGNITNTNATTLDVSGNATVDGTSTLTGAVTAAAAVTVNETLFVTNAIKLVDSDTAGLGAGTAYGDGMYIITLGDSVHIIQDGTFKNLQME